MRGTLLPGGVTVPSAQRADQIPLLTVR